MATPRADRALWSAVRRKGWEPIAAPPAVRRRRVAAGAPPVRRPLPALTLSIRAADQRGLPVRATLRRWVQLAQERPSDLTLAFLGEAKARRLNREFRGRDYATNVLTFTFHSRPRVVADIVLCTPVVRREARARGLTLRAHLAHLVIHGVLHAHGYDHERDAEAARMQRREVELLGALRIPDPYR